MSRHTRVKSCFIFLVTLAFFGTWFHRSTFGNPGAMIGQVAYEDDLNCKMIDTYSYEEMKSDMTRLWYQYPGAFTVDSLGQTVDGREIYHLLIGNAAADKHILITGSIHGREYITSQAVMLQTADLLYHIHQDQAAFRDTTYQALMENTAVHIVPMINPDGVSISQDGLFGIQNAEVRQNIYRIYELDQAVEIDPYLRRWKSNAEGIDINRNFDALWESYQDNLGHPSADHYKGTNPESTIEARALVDLTYQYRFARTISYHAQGEVLYWYFGQMDPLLTETRVFTEEISRVTGYRMDGNAQNLDPAGYKDWAIMKCSIPSITIEVGTGDVPVADEQIATIYQQNKDVIPATLYMIK